MRLLLLFLGLSFAPFLLNVEAQVDTDHKHNEQHTHHHEKNEIGVGNALTWFFSEKELAYGMHLHYFRSIGHSKFAVGIGYERVFDEHGHNTIGILAAFRPAGQLVLQLSPGISFEDGGMADPDLVAHIEISYEFEIGDVHLGPMLGVSLAPEHYHAGAGIHLAYTF